MKREFTNQEAMDIGAKIGIDFSKIRIDQFKAGLAVEFEHGSHDPETDVTHDDLLMTGKIAWAHLKEIDDYYTRLATMESEAESKQKEHK